MANFFKSLFGSKKSEESSENGKDKTSLKNFDILKYDGIRAQRMGRIDYAIKCYANAINIQEDFEVMGYLSQLYIQTEEYDSAKELLQRMTEMEPQVISSYLTLGNLFFIRESYPEMIKVLEKGISIEEGNVNAHYLLAKAKKYIKEYTQAIDHLTRAIEIDEDIIEPFLMRAEVYMELTQYSEALADIEKVLQLQDEEEHALLLRGKLYELTGKPEEAEKDYLQVTELNPFHDQAFINLAQLYIKQEKYAEAISLSDEAIDFNPNSAGLYNERANAKSSSGDKEGAESDKKMAVKLSVNEADKKAEEPKMRDEEPKNSLGLPFS